MASFRTHISFGIALGVLSAIGIASLALVPAEWSYLVLVGLMVTIGALMPDIDSDSGIPFHVTFGSLALVAGGLGALYAYTAWPGNYWLLLGVPVAAIFIVWGVIGVIFKKFTRHRGMAHSIPAAILAGLITFSVTTYLGFADWQAFLLGLALTAGYILHLILDEVWAGMNFHGQLFVPNKAFGSALKLVSHDHRLTVITYLAIAGMISLNSSELYQLTRQLLVIF